MRPPHAVMETPDFERWLTRFTPAVALHIVLEVATRYAEGDYVQETGGVQKLRVALPGGGKSGGLRVFYVYLGENAPIVALVGLSKNERANLSKADRNAMREMVHTLKAGARATRRNPDGGFAPGRLAMATFFERMREGLQHALAVQRGEASAHMATLVPPPEPKALRAKLNYTQAQLAQACNVSLATVRSWEQGRRRPSGPAALTLRLLASSAATR